MNFRFLLLIFVFRLSCSSLVLKNNMEANCKINVNALHHLYRLYLNEADTVTVTVISSCYSQENFPHVLNRLLQFLYLRNNFKIKLQQLLYNDTKCENERTAEATEIDEEIAIKQEYLNKFNTIRSYSGVAHKIYVSFVWDQLLLKSVMDQKPDVLMGNPRATYLIIYISCTCFYDLFEEILTKFWTHFNILNVLLFSSCSKYPNKVFVYKPFLRRNSTWGVLKTYNIDDVLKDPISVVNSMKFFNRYPLRTGLFLRKPTALSFDKMPRPIKENPIYKTLNSVVGFGGFDACVLAAVVERLGFTVDLSWMPERYGKLNNGMYTGSLGAVVYKRVDISANGRFMIKYESDSIEFTNPVSNDEVCVVVPKSLKIPQWIKIFRCFRADTWILLVFIWNSCVGFLFFIKKYHAYNYNSSSVVMEMIAIFLTVPTKLSQQLSHRIFLASCMGFTVIVTSIFQGSLVKSFTTTSYYPDIDTLDELDKSGLPIATSLKVFENDNSDLIKRLQSKITAHNTSSLERAAIFRDVAGVERREDANLLISTEYIKNNDYPLVHIVNECPSSYFVAYIVPKGSPFLPRINNVISKFFEAGFLSKWYDDIFDGIVLATRKKNYAKNMEKSFNLKDVQVAFYILLIGILLAAIIFVLEIYL